MVSYTLFELNEYVKRVIALNFQEPVWIECELSQVKESRGNYYLDFVQKKEDSEEIIAQSGGYIWFKNALFLKKKLGELFQAILKDGTAVKVKVSVEFHERYGLKLNVEDIDPTFTVGQLELIRQKILQRLQDEGKLDLNKRNRLPSVVQRIAIISAENAAGYIDFINQLAHNPYGYQYKTTLFSAALQGSNTEREVVSALETIFSQKQNFDVIAIIRGGGSKLDLAAFDNYNIAHSISQSPLPVLSGIGHEIDVSVTDLVSHTFFKTPTALAAFLIDYNADFEGKIMDKTWDALLYAQNIIRQHQIGLNQTISTLWFAPSEKLRHGRVLIDNNLSKLGLISKNIVQTQQEKLRFIEIQLELLNPREILKKGFAMVSFGGEWIKSSKSVKDKNVYSLVFSDGTIPVIKTEDEQKK